MQLRRASCLMQLDHTNTIRNRTHLSQVSVWMCSDDLGPQDTDL